MNGVRLAYLRYGRVLIHGGEFTRSDAWAEAEDSGDREGFWRGQACVIALEGGDAAGVHLVGEGVLADPIDLEERTLHLDAARVPDLGGAVGENVHAGQAVRGGGGKEVLDRDQVGPSGQGGGRQEDDAHPRRQWDQRSSHGLSYSATASTPRLKAMASPSVSTTTVSPSANSPSRRRSASGSWTSRWMVRLSGRAPKVGS